MPAQHLLLGLAGWSMLTICCNCRPCTPLHPFLPNYYQKMSWCDLVYEIYTWSWTVSQDHLPCQVQSWVVIQDCIASCWTCSDLCYLVGQILTRAYQSVLMRWMAVLFIWSGLLWWQTAPFANVNQDHLCVSMCEGFALNLPWGVWTGLLKKVPRGH